MVEMVCYIEDGAIVDGPFDILKKKSYLNISVPYALTAEQRLDYGFFPLDTVVMPEYNEDTQHITSAYTVNESSVTPAYTVVDYLDIYIDDKWCLVEDAAVKSGPSKLPRLWKGDELWLLTEAEVNGKGWRIYIDEPPDYDIVTQTRTKEDTINPTNVTATYTVADKSLASAKTAKLMWIRQQAQSVILSAYPGWYQDNVALGIYDSTISDPMKAHIAGIISESNTQEDAIIACETTAAVRTIEPVWPEE